MRVWSRLILSVFAALCLALAVIAQDTNPVEKEVANPISDTPNVNPVAPEQKITTILKKSESGLVPEGGGDEIVVYSDRQTVEGEAGKRILIHEGNVDVRYGIYRLQADKITIYEETANLAAEGNVVFDQGDDQRITGSSGTWNYKTKLGKFVNSTGYTNQTNDGAVLYFTAERVERIGLNEVELENAEFTACEDAVPKWSFTADSAKIIANDKVKLKKPRFRIKGFPILPLPSISLPIKKEDRSSGFLTPGFGFSANKGVRVSGAYYKTFGRSVDATVRADLFTGRGIGYGFDVRTRANSRSYFDFGLYGVVDRILGSQESEEYPDQGGTMFYAEGIHYFSNGFVGVADVRFTSNLAFRQVFLDGVQQIISPIETSDAFVNKSWRNYSLNIRTRSAVISIPNVRVKTRNLPGIHFEKRPALLSFFKNAYFTYKTSLDGVSRREDVDSVEAYRLTTGSDPVVTPAIGQRFDVHPQLIIPYTSKYFSLTATVGGRVTYYSDTFNDMRRVVGTDAVRKYGEIELDFRPAALARNFYGKGDEFRFRHVIEPYVRYKLVKGINNFNKFIRFDYADTQTDTNEIEFGLTNRIFTRRYSEAVTDEARETLKNTGSDEQDETSIQPYELFTVTVRGKYFFDPYFGGALVPGRRNQIVPVTDLTYYTFTGVPRRFSPVNVEAVYRPLNTVSVSTKMDIGVRGGGLRNISATIGYSRNLLKFFQSFYYTRAVDLVPSLRQFANRFGKEPGTLRGAQWSPAIFIGDKNDGFYAGTSLFFDFENRRETKDSPLISSLYTLGYAFDCCSVSTQFYTFDVGQRRENRVVFSFRLNGIGAFGTEQFGQALF
ncbi:MAG: LPS assembly protein LptD [Acidobacteriota bacterium]|nr:LPS assembly protein LptD [Acidobacteriota bacterium]